MIALQDVHFQYDSARFQFHLDHLEVADAVHAAVAGPSGCGKTTLLRLVSGILLPQSGSVRVRDRDLTTLPDEARRASRLDSMGLVFQDFELLDYLSARENILLPGFLHPEPPPPAEQRERLARLAAAARISHLLEAFPHELSRGEQQRVALCRALILQPSLILADEPTASLDPETQDLIIEMLRAEARALHATLVMVTHEHGVLDRFDQVIQLSELLAPAP